MRSEGYCSRSVPVSVCLCVCVSTTILALQATRRLISDTNSFSATRARKLCGDFAETTAFERYGVKKPICIMSTGNPLTITQLACESYM